MSVRYVPVKWNRNKRMYDAVIVAGIVVYLGLFLEVGSVALPADERLSFPILLMRALGTCSLLMLHIVLAIGPLARLDKRFLPLIYNRRHLGVATFLVGSSHAAVAVGYYHGFGSLDPLVSIVTANRNYASLTAFPFEVLGFAALSILFVMAATSHDFWQKVLGASTWKWLHMLVYPAYGLLVLHVGLGALQSESSFLYPAFLGVGFTVVASLHIIVGLRESHRDGATVQKKCQRVSLDVGWLDVGSVDDIPEGRAKVVCLPGQERVAVFRYSGNIAAVTNVCAHQRGPLGEGKVIDGCVTCPWHGWEYRPADGCSPPPFAEKIATYRVIVKDRRVLLDPIAQPPGTTSVPACIEE